MTAINDGIDEDRFTFLVNNMLETPIYQATGIKPLLIGNGYTELTIEDCSFCNSKGHIHGGAQMTCADTAMGFAVRATGYRTSTVQMDSSFLHPCPSDAHIVCRGSITKSGSNLFFCQADLFADDLHISSFSGVFVNLGPEAP